jgi:transposase
MKPMSCHFGHAGAQWRRLPDAHGKSSPVLRRYRRWTETSVFNALLESLADPVTKANDMHMIDSTVVRAHDCGTGKKKRGTPRPSGVRRLASRPCPA